MKGFMQIISITIFLSLFTPLSADNLDDFRDNVEQEEEENAKEKMRSKNLDMIVLNNPEEFGAGFATDTNKVTIFVPRKKAMKLPLMRKSEVASVIIEEITKILKKRKSK